MRSDDYWNQYKLLFRYNMQKDKKFIFERVLLIDQNHKKINILGNFGNEEKAIILLEKNNFPEIKSNDDFSRFLEIEKEIKYHEVK